VPQRAADSMTESSPIFDRPPSEGDTPGNAEPSPDGGRAVRRRIRLVVLIVLMTGAVLASSWLLGTEDGRRYLDRAYLAQVGEQARGWMQQNPALTLGGFVLAYCVCAVFLLPVWWLQMLSGFALGIWGGLGWIMVCSTTGALLTAQVSRWLGEEWVRERIVGHGKIARRMRRVAELAGRNGLLLVLISRLSYPVPYGVSNYLFGLLNLRRLHIAVGTALGGTPVYAGWVAAGARPDWLGRWEFWVVTIGVNLALLVPLLVRSARKNDNAAEMNSPEVPHESKAESGRSASSVV
jgi:uncharacterized membrane protein YdjX (TVP38/TMEM64 family)